MFQFKIENENLVVSDVVGLFLTIKISNFVNYLRKHNNEYAYLNITYPPSVQRIEHARTGKYNSGSNSQFLEFEAQGHISRVNITHIFDTYLTDIFLYLRKGVKLADDVMTNLFVRDRSDTDNVVEIYFGSNYSTTSKHKFVDFLIKNKYLAPIKELTFDDINSLNTKWENNKFYVGFEKNLWYELPIIHYDKFKAYMDEPGLMRIMGAPSQNPCVEIPINNKRAATIEKIQEEEDKEAIKALDEAVFKEDKKTPISDCFESQSVEILKKQIEAEEDIFAFKMINNIVEEKPKDRFFPLNEISQSEKFGHIYIFFNLANKGKTSFGFYSARDFIEFLDKYQYTSVSNSDKKLFKDANVSIRKVSLNDPNSNFRTEVQFTSPNGDIGRFIIGEIDVNQLYDYMKINSYQRRILKNEERDKAENSKNFPGTIFGNTGNYKSKTTEDDYPLSQLINVVHYNDGAVAVYLVNGDGRVQIIESCNQKYIIDYLKDRFDIFPEYTSDNGKWKLEVKNNLFYLKHKQTQAMTKEHTAFFSYRDFSNYIEEKNTEFKRLLNKNIDNKISTIINDITSRNYKLTDRDLSKKEKDNSNTSVYNDIINDVTGKQGETINNFQPQKKDEDAFCKITAIDNYSDGSASLSVNYKGNKNSIAACKASYIIDYLIDKHNVLISFRGISDQYNLEVKFDNLVLTNKATGSKTYQVLPQEINYEGLLAYMLIKNNKYYEDKNDEYEHYANKNENATQRLVDSLHLKIKSLEQENNELKIANTAIANMVNVLQKNLEDQVLRSESTNLELSKQNVTLTSDNAILKSDNQKLNELADLDKQLVIELTDVTKKLTTRVNELKDDNKHYLSAIDETHKRALELFKENEKLKTTSDLDKELNQQLTDTFNKRANELKDDNKYYLSVVDATHKRVMEVKAENEKLKHQLDLEKLSQDYTSKIINQQSNIIKTVKENSLQNIIKSDAIKAAYRIGAMQSINALKATIITLLKTQGKDNNVIQSAISFLDTEIGTAIISSMCGYALSYSNFDSTFVEDFSKELRTQGMTVAGNVAFETLFTTIINNVVPLMSSMPNVIENNETEIVSIQENTEVDEYCESEEIHSLMKEKI